MRIFPSIILISAAIQLQLLADELDLAEGGQLNGAVRSISPEGIITAELEIADKPVELIADKVTRVRFSKASGDFNHDTMLTLVNGDRLPGELTSISDTDVTISTGYAGALTIPRKFVTTVQLGIRPRKTIYSGPENLKDWNVDDNWHFEDRSMVSDGRGSISREFSDLPDSYSLSFRLQWSDKPMFKIFFASDSATVSGGKHDRYYMQVVSAGIEIKRQSSGRNSYHTLIPINRSHDTFAEQQARFEIRFDHRQQRILLYIDGELEGQAADPLSKIPEGKVLILQSEASEAEAHRVSEIVLREWDAAGERHSSEDRGESAEDALINNKGERWGGRLIGSKGTGQDIVLLIKSPFSPEALEVPSNEVSTLFFRKTDIDGNSNTPLVLGLAGSGSVGARACTFGADEVELTHPLLGPLKLRRDVVKLLQRRKWPEELEAPTETEPPTEE